MHANKLHKNDEDKKEWFEHFYYKFAFNTKCNLIFEFYQWILVDSYHKNILMIKWLLSVWDVLNWMKENTLPLCIEEGKVFYLMVFIILWKYFS